jgi:ferrous iron transport protein B
MATRSVPDPNARLTTILVAPFMTCSARLPVYALLIGAFIPATNVFGFMQLQGLVLFGLYLLGSVSALVAAWLFTRNKQVGKTLPFYLELPPYRIPTFRDVYARMKIGVGSFLRKAGTIILVATVVLWALMSFPMQENDAGNMEPVAVGESYAASIGKGIEPAFEPLGYDWKISLGLIGSLAAREVIVSTLSQIYAIDAPEGEEVESLGQRLQAETTPEGQPAYTLATALSLLVFFVYSLQCVSTLAVMRRETKTWKWPAFAFAYMFAIAYVGALITYQVTNAVMG